MSEKRAIRPSNDARHSKHARERSVARTIRSNVAEPAGVLGWEREFLLPLAVDVLEDFVRSSDEGE